MEQWITIGEVVARRSGLAASAIRFYEGRGLVHAERAPRAASAGSAATSCAGWPSSGSRQRVGLSLDEIAAALAGLPARPGADQGRLAADHPGLAPDRIDERISVLEALRGGLSQCIGCGCLSLRTCALSNPDDWAASLGPGPRYLLGDAAHDPAGMGTRGPTTSG